MVTVGFRWCVLDKEIFWNWEWGRTNANARGIDGRNHDRRQGFGRDNRARRNRQIYRDACIRKAKLVCKSIASSVGITDQKILVTVAGITEVSGEDDLATDRRVHSRIIEIPKRNLAPL